MENVTLIFKGSEESGTDKIELICECNIFNEITISLKDIEEIEPYNFQYISLSKQTAVRLVRELKKQIGFIESEVLNG
jgi:hypothetical protein